MLFRSRVVIDHAASGDREALALLSAAGVELGRLAMALRRRVGALPVVLGGGVGRSSPALFEALRRETGLGAALRVHATDPVLTDSDRILINTKTPDARLAVARDAAARNLDLWRRLLGRVRGEVRLGFSCRDAANDADVFPSPALVALHAQVVGNPLATAEIGRAHV